MTHAERNRLLRECAVDLVRASDLDVELSALRVRGVVLDLAKIEASFKAETRIHDASVAGARLRSVA